MSYLAIVLGLLVQAGTAPVARLYPVDETGRDPQFRSYVAKLRAAVATRDTVALRKLVDEEVVAGPAADDKGWTKFVERWRPEDRENSPVWPALSDMLSLGFVREHPSLFLSPYIVWRFPHELSMATHIVVIRDKAALREAPSLSARLVDSLSFDVVRQLGPPEAGGELDRWVHVRTLEGKTGYVNTRDVMSPLMPRAQFGIRRGRWLLVALEGEDQ